MNQETIDSIPKTPYLRFFKKNKSIVFQENRNVQPAKIADNQLFVFKNYKLQFEDDSWFVISGDLIQVDWCHDNSGIGFDSGWFTVDKETFDKWDDWGNKRTLKAGEDIAITKFLFFGQTIKRKEDVYQLDHGWGILKKTKPFEIRVHAPTIYVDGEEIS